MEKLLHLGTGSDRPVRFGGTADRKSTRLNSSHLVISYAVFCLKKKKTAHAAQPRVVFRISLVDPEAHDVTVRCGLRHRPATARLRHHRADQAQPTGAARPPHDN